MIISGRLTAAAVGGPLKEIAVDGSDILEAKSQAISVAVAESSPGRALGRRALRRFSPREGPHLQRSGAHAGDQELRVRGGDGDDTLPGQ